MDQARKFGEQTSRILEFKPKRLDFQFNIFQIRGFFQLNCEIKLEVDGSLVYKNKMCIFLEMLHLKEMNKFFHGKKTNGYKIKFIVKCRY